MEPIVLRHDQQDLKNRIYSDWNAGVRNVLAVLPTGGGKSVIMSDIAKDGFAAGMKQAIIAHRNELVSQLSGHVANRGIPHRIIASNSTVSQITREHREKHGRSFVNPSAATAIVGVDTLISRADSLQQWANQIDVWMGDEWHHCLVNNKWGKAVAMFPRARGLGVTATPCRADGFGLGRDFDGVMDSLQVGLDMRCLISINALSDYEIVCPKSDLEPDEKDIGATGDWSSKKLRSAAKKSRIVGDVVSAYCQYAFGRKTICFSTDVETAGEQARRFVDSNIPAVALSGQTPPSVREKYIKDFKSGKIWVLINVDLFDEGFDVPACDVVIMARPTASLGKYRQMFGRALRPMPGKVALIIDLVSNVLRHKLPDKPVVWSLARREKKQSKDPDEIPLTVCATCTRPYEKFYTACPHCGAEPPLPEPRQRTIQSVDGDLMLLDRETLEKMRQQTELESPGSLAERVGHVAGPHAATARGRSQMDKIAAQASLKDTIAQWAAIERAAGFNDRQIHKKFYFLTGFDVLSAISAERSKQEYETLSEKIKDWYEKQVLT